MFASRLLTTTALTCEMLANIVADILEHYAPVSKDILVGPMLKWAAFTEPHFDGRLRDTLGKALASSRHTFSTGLLAY